MHTFELIKAILHGIDFYWRKFIFFILLGALLLGGILILKNQTRSSADLKFSEVPQYATESQRTMDINLTRDGKVIINGKDESQTLKILPEYYEVRILAIDNPGTFIYSFQAIMHLPKPVPQDQVEQLIYAVHGVSSYNAAFADPETLIFTAESISSQATLTIAAHLPKDLLTPPLGKRIVYNITNIPAREYLTVALALPIIILVILIFMVVKRRRDQILNFNIKPNEEMPANAPPAIAGVLLDGQVGAREIAATLIDLASRGYIFIVKKKNSFSFGQRKSLNLENSPELRSFEKKLLSKIFENQGYKSTKDDVEMRVGRHIFSRKIAMVYLEIYNEATRLGYFVQNPASVHRKWKYTGIGFFFIGLLGFAHSAFFAPDPKFTLIFWAGEMAAAWVIIKISGLMPARSGLGSRELSSWMAFRNYLKEKRPIEPGASISDKFTRNLPFAIVFGVEVEWTKRFLHEPFVKPSWYESDDANLTMENFTGGLFSLIGFTGGILAKSHEPTVE